MSDVSGRKNATRCECRVVFAIQRRESIRGVFRLCLTFLADDLEHHLDPLQRDSKVSQFDSLTEQQTRDLHRRNELQDQLAKIQAGTPDRQTIVKAIKNLEGLWEHLTMGERSRLMSQLVASIDHDPTDSTLSITLSPLGLKSFATKKPNNEETKKS
jgi:hypothetical protein